MAITKKQSAELARQVFEYAPAPEAIDHVKIQPRYGLFIGGRIGEGHNKKKFPTLNPAPQEKMGQGVGGGEGGVRPPLQTTRQDFDFLGPPFPPPPPGG